MALEYLPPTVTNGLILSFDAANLKSYYGASLWSNLVDSDLDSGIVYVTGITTFSAINRGSINFDGVDDVVWCGESGASLVNGLTELTLEMWYKSTGIGTDTGLIFGGSLQGAPDVGQDNGFSLRFDSAGANGGGTNVIKAGFGEKDATGGNQLESSSNIQSTDWTCIAVAVDMGTSIALYKNGLVDTPTYSSTDESSVSNCNDLQIGRGSTGILWDGNISIVKIYNRVLTAIEILQNYNAIKDRYESLNPVSIPIPPTPWTPPAEPPGPSLYDFTSAYFTVSRGLVNSSGSDAHRYGPTQVEVRAWLSGSSNGGGSHSWANTYVDCPVQGYQRWTIPKNGKYRITAKGGGGGHTDEPNDYMRGAKVIADFNLTQNEKLILVAGQGVPNFDGDHCNGGGGASWVMSGDTYTTAIPLIVANGAGGDTSDGSTKVQPNTTLGSNITVTPTSGEGGGAAVTGKQTTPVLGGSAVTGRGSQLGDKPNSAGWLSDGADAGVSGCGGHCFRTDLIGGIRSNSTAGYGAFGGGSGGEDESGSAGGGFTGAHGEDNTSNTGHGSSFVNDINVGSVSVALAQATTTFQNSDYTSEAQYNGWVKIEFIS